MPKEKIFEGEGEIDNLEGRTNARKEAVGHGGNTVSGKLVAQAHCPSSADSFSTSDALVIMTYEAKHA